MPTCWHCNAESPAAHYARVVENKTTLHAEWDGWRMAGRFLIAPGKAGRIMPARLLGILWAESRSLNLNVQKRRSPFLNENGDRGIVKLPARELFRGQA